MLFAVVFRVIGSLLTIQRWANYGIPIYAVILELVSVFVLILILRKILAYLNKEQRAFKLAASKADE